MIVTRYTCAEYLRHRGYRIDERAPIFRRYLMSEIQAAVAEHYELPVRVMTDRYREHSRPRQVAMYLCRQITGRSLPEIGRRFGGRDHTTVIHAVKQIEKLRHADHVLAADVRAITARLEA